MNHKMVLTLIFSISLFITSAHADVPSKMSYQGKLTDDQGVPVSDGNYSIQFLIYTDEVGGSILWQEPQNVAVADGLFNVLLGDVNPIPDTVFTGSTRWLGIQVSPDPELTPRKPIVSVGYAFRALDADTANYALSAPVSPDDDWVISGDTIYHLTGNVGIGTPSPANKLHIVGSESVPLLNVEQSGSHRGVRVYTTNACALWVANAGNHGLRVTDAGGDGIHVEHADGWAGYFNGTGYFSGNVGIGTSPDEELHVVGNIKMVDGNQAAGYILTSDANGVGSWQAAVGDNDWIIIGNVLHPAADYGLSQRQSNIMYGQHDSTHVNFGIGCTTGTSAQDYKYCTVGGGRVNAASGDLATVAGGEGNKASNSSAAIGGGWLNLASGAYATVGGGSKDTASGDYSTVAGGARNKATNSFAVVGGGIENTASGQYSTVSGGRFSMADGQYSGVGSGYSNLATDTASTIAGGRNNRARGSYSFVGGGGGADAADSNSALGDYSAISGGSRNTASWDYTTVGGGYNNTADTSYATVGGGYLNTASGYRATVGGGTNNEASGDRATVAGGGANTADTSYATVGGGYNNTASNNRAAVGGGTSNTASGYCATVGGGYADTASGSYSTVPGGRRNKASGDHSFAAGGRAKAIHSGAFVWADGTDADFVSTAANQFLIRASGGVGIGTTSTGSSALIVLENATGTIGRVVNFERTQDPSSENDMLQIKVPSTAPADFQFIECERGTDAEFKVEGDGDVFADGSYTGPADFSEMMAVSSGASTVEPGDVMVVDPNNARAILRASRPRSTLVAGIYSTKPGFIGSERDWDKPVGDEVGTYTLKEMAQEFNEIPLAVVGIVPCKVSAENGPIQPGDLLVTSGTPGHVMRDDNPKVGTVVGKALGSLSSGTGVIEILVTLH